MADNAKVVIDGDNAPLKESLRESENMFTEWGVAIKTNIVAIGATLVINLVSSIRSALSESIAAVMEDDDTIGRMEDAVARLGDTAGVTADQIMRLSEELHKRTKFEDMDIVAAQTAMLNFNNISEKVWERAIRGAADWAESAGIPVQSAASMLAKALNDPERGFMLLQSAGVLFTDQQKEVIAKLIETGDIATAQGMILSELEKRFQGAAEEGAKRLSGELTNMNKEWEDMRNEIGEAFLPIIREMIPMLKDYATVIKDDIVPALVGWVEWLDKVTGAMQNASPKTIEDKQTEYARRLKEKQELLLEIEGDGVAQFAYGINEEDLKREIEQLKRIVAGYQEGGALYERDKRAEQKIADDKAAAAKAIKDEEDAKAAEAQAAIDLENSQRASRYAAHGENRLRAHNSRMGMITMAAGDDEPEFFMPGMEPEGTAKDARPFWEIIAEGIAKNARGREFRDEGFRSGTDDILGLNRRIASAAASLSPEAVRLDQLIVQGNEALAQAKENGAAVVEHLDKISKKVLGGLL